jgi:hypothetical protein
MGKAISIIIHFLELCCVGNFLFPTKPKLAAILNTMEKWGINVWNTTFSVAGGFSNLLLDSTLNYEPHILQESPSA